MPAIVSNHTEINQEFTCAICDFRTRSIKYHKKHMKRHTTLGKVKCDVCNKELSHKDSLTKHMLIHQGEKREVCKICKKTFLARDGLRNHMKYHLQNLKKDFECATCHYKTHARSVLEKHLQIHNGLRYNCVTRKSDMRYMRKITNVFIVRKDLKVLEI